MEKSKISGLLQLPARILLLLIFAGFVYLVFLGAQGLPGSYYIKYAIPIWIIIVLYFAGVFIKKKSSYPSF